MIHDADHLFIYWLAICMCSLENLSIQVLCSFLIVIIINLLLNCMSSYTFFILTPYEIYGLQPSSTIPKTDIFVIQYLF